MKLEITIERRPEPYALPEEGAGEQARYITWWNEYGRRMDRLEARVFDGVDSHPLPRRTFFRDVSPGDYHGIASAHEELVEDIASKIRSILDSTV